MFITILLFCFVQTRANFVVIGDWGRNTRAQANIARTIDQINPDFVISTGDNFYPNGIQHSNDIAINTTWQNVFGQQRPWVSVLGNHDYLNNATAQMHIPYKTWIMPAHYFKVTYKATDIWFIDTTPIMPFNYVEVHHQRLGGIPKQARKYFAQQRQKSHEQIEWLQQTIAESNATRKFIVGHHPMWTYGYHRFGNHTRLIDLITDLHKKYHIDAYLCGHDHNLQHIHKNDIHLFLSGAGASTYKVHHGPGQLFRTEQPGIIYILNKQATFINQYNQEIYTTQFIQ